MKHFTGGACITILMCAGQTLYWRSMSSWTLGCLPRLLPPAPPSHKVILLAAAAGDFFQILRVLEAHISATLL